MTHMELFCLDALEVLADGGLLGGVRAPVAQQEGDPTQVLHLDQPLPHPRILLHPINPIEP
jgi:hypothetical protein